MEIDSVLAEININDQKATIQVEKIQNLKSQIDLLHESNTKTFGKFANSLELINKFRSETKQLGGIIEENDSAMAVLEEQCDILESNLSLLRMELSQRQEKTSKVKSNDQVSAIEKYAGISMEVKSAEKYFYQIKITFDPGQFVILSYNYIERVFNLLHMQPAHPKIEAITEFLQHTGDISGFLCQTRIYFNKKNCSS